MSPETFCYWLNGYCELDGAHPTPEQWKSIQEHLKLVFNKVTPEVIKEPASLSIKINDELKSLSAEDVKEILRKYEMEKGNYYDHQHDKWYLFRPPTWDIPKVTC